MSESGQRVYLHHNATSPMRPEAHQAWTAAIEDKVEIHDLHATILHLLGIDHEQLTVRFSGRDMRLTDVHGEVIHDWIA